VTAEKPLTAAELREALRLVAAELEDMGGWHDPLSTAGRLGRLQAHVRTIVGDSPHGTDPIYGLHALRRNQEEVTPTDSPR
jgi:hypothetical protein